MAQVEISAPLSVLDDLGRPVNFGWARKPLFTYDDSLQRGSSLRVTASDRYIIFSHTHLIILEILDGGCLGYTGISILSLKDKKRSTQIFTTPFPLGSYNLPNSSESGTVRVQRKKRLLEFVAMEGGARIIKADFPKFGHHRFLRGAVVLSPPPNAESMVTHMPLLGSKNAFILSRRSPWYIAEGVIQFGTAEIVFTKGNAWGILDWNRGCRSRSDMSYWAAACGMEAGSADPHQIGFTVGYGADSSLGTENAFFVDGKLHKLDQVTFHISPADWLEPWRFTSNDNRLEMTFVPSQGRIERNQMFTHILNRRQVCGSFSGKVILDDGRELTFKNLMGIAERRKSQF
jgi:hypothetical protein